MENDKSKDSCLHVVMFPFFAFGHISPFVQLSNKLSSHGVKISFFSASANVIRVRSMLNDASTTQIIPLTVPQVEDLPPGVESTADLNPTQSELIKAARTINYAKSQFKKPVLLVGPLPPEPRPDQTEEKWAKWLDKFEANSVIYCSFGSETFLTDDQIKELASGLELTGLPFFLVLNFPANSDVSTKLKMALPEGFSERVEAKGIIHSGWVQQQQILAHKSVGCFLCHAGFSSVIEAIVNDCQLVMLPQKGDQYGNSKLVHGDLKAGVEVNRNDEDGFFGREDIKRAVEKVMLNIDEEPGKSIRNNQRKWKEFLRNKDIQNNFIKNLVKEMEEIAGISSI